jgi:hypothetical protein
VQGEGWRVEVEGEWFRIQGSGFVRSRVKKVPDFWFRD